MAKGPSHYQILGLKPTASDKDIKMSYFALAKKFHPDLNPNESARLQFEKISAAYETLSDESKKQIYDNTHGFGKRRSRDGGSFRDYHQHKNRRANSTIFSDDENDADAEEEYYDLYRRKDNRTMPGRDQQNDANMGWRQRKAAEQFWNDNKKKKAASSTKEQFRQEVFDEFDEFFDFKRQAAESGVTRDDTIGADLKTEISIEFTEAINGKKVEIELNKRITCTTCKGTRAQPGSKPRKCFECGGRGSVIGNFNIKKRCMKCEGAGCLPKVFCSDCEGIGVQREVVKETVELPSGLKDGQKLKVP